MESNVLLQLSSAANQNFSVFFMFSVNSNLSEVSTFQNTFFKYEDSVIKKGYLLIEFANKLIMK